MTICIGALFKWNYAQPGQPLDLGPAAIAISDRMITAGAGDIEYEPLQRKMWFPSDRIVVMIAGDYTVHSQAIKETSKQIRNNPGVGPYEVAKVLGANIQAIVRKQAEDLILAPIGLNTDTFLAQQKEMSEHVASALTAQLQDFVGPDVRALVVGIDNLSSHLYEIDGHGTVRCYDDVGFAAIGIGASHANSVMTQNGYYNNLSLAPALAVAYTAKKAAETAPGVGTNTDIQIILRGGGFPIWHGVQDRLSFLYAEYANKRSAIAMEAVQKLQEFINAPENSSTPTVSQTAASARTVGTGNREEAGCSPSTGTEDKTDAAEPDETKPA